MTNISRRDLGRFLGGAGALAAFSQLGLSASVAQTAPSDFRAMVGIFLFGGNDSWNLVAPTDARHAAYVTSRGSTLALPLASLSRLTGTAFGLHPSFAPLQTAWNEGAMNVVLNTGTLFQPLTKTLYQQRSDLRPINLMSHSDEQAHWQGNRARSENMDGFMGRLTDKMAAGNTPSLISIAGSQLAVIGKTSSPLILPSNGTLTRSGYNAASTDAATVARQQAVGAFADGLGLGRVTELTAGGISSAYAQMATANGIVTSTTSTTDTFFRNAAGTMLTSDIARQLMRAARMIEARVTLGHSRQTFFVSQGGYDTHSNQVDGTNTTGTQANLFTDLAYAMAGFYAAMKSLGLANNVTAFTMSDFGRVYKANAQRGTDHAWGGNHLVIGGALKDRTVHGAYPDPVLGGADDPFNDGRFIPTIAQEEYIGAIAKWHGVAEADLPYVFPNWATWSGGGRGPVPMFG